MCSSHISQETKKQKFLYHSLFYGIIIICSILTGLSDYTPLHTLAGLISDIFIKIFKCISLPIIALSLIVTLSQYNAESGMKDIWKRTLFYTLTTTLIAASISALLYVLIKPSLIQLSPDTLNSSIGMIKTDISNFSNKETSYLQHIINLIPNNIFSPFIEQQVLGVLLVGIIVGIAIRFIPDLEAKKSITNFFKGFHGIFLIITRWIVFIIPVALFGFMSTTVLSLRQHMDFTGIAAYLLIVVAANLIQGLIILPIWLKWNRIHPLHTMRAMMPALSMAFLSKSSAGTLPITIETAEKNLKMDPKISRFILPLCTAINMNGCAAFIIATVLYLMQNYGIEIQWTTIVLWIGISTIAAIGNAGVPMGCFFLSASLLASMNVPITLLGIILPFYSLIDMLETALNVWSDSCVAKVVNEKAKRSIQIQEEQLA